MLTRVADSLYWLGRNIERAETIARILDVNYTRAMDLYSMRDGRGEHLWRSVMRCAGFVADPQLPAGGRVAAEVIAFCGLDHENPYSLRSSIRIARTNALGIRSELTSEVWETVNALYLYAEEQEARSVLRSGPSKFLRRVRDAAHAFAGVTSETLTHGDRWSYLVVGRFFERAYMTVRMLDAVDIEREPWPEAQRLLEMCCAGEPFTQTVGHASEPRDVLEFLILHRQFPRSLHFCMRRVDEAMHAISGTPPDTFANDAERRLGRARAMLDYASIGDVLGGGLPAFGAAMREEFEALHAAISASYQPGMVGAP
ncbi:MAG TPA: alpha-E domain-containing protein [Candidatus Dormibacteraeota bacterium]|nr:alpha-E domain-containing protein [Candidatus Dormibacteraeota bacterium]